MRKELVISSIPQETRVAVLEDGELVELLIERRRSQGIAGNIYKGKVTKVLPGMQSAFVDIGLERDAFLYVSDFLEDAEEYERMAATAEDEALRDEGSSKPATRRLQPESSEGDGVRDRKRREPKRNREAPASAVDAKPAVRPNAASDDSDSAAPVDKRPRRPTGRQDEPASKPKADSPDPRPEPSVRKAPAPMGALPGETLAKYGGRKQAADRPVIPGGSEAQPRKVIEDRPVPQGRREPAEQAIAATVISEPAPPAPVVDVGGAPSGPGTARSEPVSGTAEAVQTDSPRFTAGNDATVPSDPLADAAPVSDDDNGPGIDTVRGEDPDKSAGSEGSLLDGETRRARIIDRGSEGRFTRRAPSRRPRRRSSVQQEGSESAPRPTISEMLKEGQEILVQVSKEPLGKKGARITSHIVLPGRYIVYMPTVDHVGVSRKIESDEERGRLRQVIAENRKDLPGGFIVRTAAEGRDESEFVQDLHFLYELWSEIRTGSDKAHAPALIHSDLGLVERVLRDQLSDEFKAIRLDSEVEYAKILEFVSKFQPSLVNRVKLHLKNTPIFEEFGLQQEIDKAMRSKVWLKSGGYIVVNQTEALVAIDVNTGKFVGKSNRLEDTIVRTNIDAVHEIVRQIRLRNLGGIIVVDFIDMEERKNRQRVMKALEEELEKNRSPSKILQFNDFGLVAITRKRTQASLERVLGMPCPRCAGSGYVKAVETVCYEIQQELKKMLEQFEGGEVTIRVSPEVAKALKSGEFVDFTELEEEFRTDIRIQSDPGLPAERFDVYE